MVKGLMRSSLCFLLNLFFASLCAQSPSVPLLIDSATATQHLVSSQQPSMPPIARAAHVFGDVKLQLFIDTSGHVSSIAVLQGPEMLRGSALDAAKKWTYRPFSRDDQPVDATTVVALTFSQSTPTYATGGPRFTPPLGLMEASIDCHQDIRANAKLEKQVKSCSKAASKADQVQDSSAYDGSRFDIYLTAANVLLRDRQFEIARAYVNKALALLERGPGGMAIVCAAYTTRAEAEWGLKEAANAERDFTAAEESERIGIEVIQDDFLKKEYTRILKNVLDVHAQFLQAAGKTEAAEAKLAEAAKL